MYRVSAGQEVRGSPLAKEDSASRLCVWWAGAGVGGVRALTIGGGFDRSPNGRVDESRRYR